MNVNKVGTRRTLCEVLREIHDITDKDNSEVINRLVEATDMGKRMVAKLVEYKSDWSKGFFEDNIDVEEKIRIRA